MGLCLVGVCLVGLTLVLLGLVRLGIVIVMLLCVLCVLCRLCLALLLTAAVGVSLNDAVLNVSSADGCVEITSRETSCVDQIGVVVVSCVHVSVVNAGSPAAKVGSRCCTGEEHGGGYDGCELHVDAWGLDVSLKIRDDYYCCCYRLLRDD